MTLRKITQKIALSALAAIFSHTEEGLAIENKSVEDLLNRSTEDDFKISIHKPNLLLMKPAFDSERYSNNPASHRSHRSHSSHRSHYSSSSGSSYTPSKKKSSSSSSSSSSRSSSTTPSSSSSTFYTPSTTVTYNLGDRTLSYNMTGSDVLDLKNLLFEKGLMDKPSSGFTSLYDSTTAEAVRNFQQKQNISVDGQAGVLTIYHLRNYIKNTDTTQLTLTSSASGTNTKTLRKGMRGPEIKSLSQLLIQKGYLVDSYYYKTFDEYDFNIEEAVKSFQKDAGLYQDGEADPTTISLLKNSSTLKEANNYSSSTSYNLGDRVLKISMRGSDVKDLNEKLEQLGFLDSTSTGDYFGESTKSAVKSFQKSSGLTADGIAGSSTISKLNYKIGNLSNLSTSSSFNNHHDEKEGQIYYVIGATSLRKTADSSAPIVDRMKVGDSVIILNSIQEKYWWKVSHNGVTGWAKAHLLRK